MNILKWSIAAKIIFMFTCLVIITATSVGMIFYYSNNKLLVQAQFSKFEKVSRRLNQSFKERIFVIQGQAEKLSKHNDLFIIKKNITDMKSHRFKTLFELNRELFSIYLIRPQVDAYKIERSGKIYKIDVKGLGFLKELGALKTAKGNLSKVHLVEKNIPVIFSSYAMYDKGKYVRTLILENSIKKVLDGYKSELIHIDSDAFILDENLRYLYSRHSSMDAFDERLGREQNSSTGHFDYKIGPNQSEHSYIKKVNGEKRLVHISKVDLSTVGTKRSFYIVISMLKSSVIKVNKAIQRRSFVFTTILIFISIAIGWVFTKILTRNLFKIIELAKRYTRGETNLDVEVRSSDEIGLLALTFKGMVRQVNERTRLMVKKEKDISDAKEEVEKALETKSSLLIDLRKRKNEIERVSKDKDDLLAIVSHDLKNPLAVIKTSLTVLLEDMREQDPSFDLLRRSKYSAEMALELITDLLDMARLEGGIKLDFTTFSLNELIETVIDLYYPKLTEKKIKLTTTFDTDYEISGDYGRIVQVISNILGNATKFSLRSGAITIGLSEFDGTKSYDGNFKNIKITIKDNGPGIPKEKIHKIFNKFEQARESDRQVGTGLGLAICKNIVELHEGTICVRSVENQGATFTITFPRLVKVGSDYKKNVEEIRAEKKSASVLLYGVDRDYCLKLSDNFSQEGHSANSYTNLNRTLEAIDKIKAKYFIYALEASVIDEEVKQLEMIENILTSKQVQLIIISEKLSAQEFRKLDKFKYRHFEKSISFKELEVGLMGTDPSSMPAVTSKKSYKLENKKRSNIFKLKASKLLIVDDSEDMQALLKVVLKKEAVELFFAKNGKEALECFRNQTYDMILMDISMPVMTGTEAVAMMREYEKENNLGRSLVIALTASDTQDDLKEYLKHGYDDMLSKPFCKSKILNYLNKKAAS